MITLKDMPEKIYFDIYEGIDGTITGTLYIKDNSIIYGIKNNHSNFKSTNLDKIITALNQISQKIKQEKESKN